MTDHPRSRGVYTSKGRPARSASGSSPLARGLRSYSVHSGAERWIIPARAGFTEYADEIMEPTTDHPRSRGVYRYRFRDELANYGSSPLARGLPYADRRTAGTLGIIPARAGVTPQGTRDAGPARDHPRSRGVYSGGKSPKDQVKGSSPLARGLRISGARIVAGSRIIPARAGFTASP